jgi:hypothetical protein
MLTDRRNPARYAVFEGDPRDCGEVGLSLAEAFHSIMAHCAYEPVWDVNGLNMRLRFRYLDEPFQGRFVGDTAPGAYIEAFYAPSFGGSVSRERIMRRVVSAGLRGWYAEPMTDFYRESASAMAGEYQYPGEVE